MKQAICERARELGFDECRATTADRPETGMRFERWLSENRHGEMEYLRRNAPKRLDPERVLAGAKTILTLAVSYASAGDLNSNVPTLVDSGKNDRFSTNESTGRRGLVARYARFRDYHDVIGAKLQSLTEWVNELGGPGTRSLWYVDTGPLLERDLAQRAGLGFIGKHTNLISRKLGNWIFLAEILTTLQLEADAPETNHCGSCARCLEACPTAAITGPFRLDARRCISYLTIELKGSIPEEFRSAVGNRIYGCDDCLAVCPWNRFAQEGKLMKSHARPDLTVADLLELLAIDQPGFERQFAGTPMARAKRNGLVRNCCVALGNIGDKTALPALQRAAEDPNPVISEHARWAIEQIHNRLGMGDKKE